MSAERLQPPRPCGAQARDFELERRADDQDGRTPTSTMKQAPIRERRSGYDMFSEVRRGANRARQADQPERPTHERARHRDGVRPGCARSPRAAARLTVRATSQAIRMSGRIASVSGLLQSWPALRYAIPASDRNES
jgi:hypothetical protein